MIRAVAAIRERCRRTPDRAVALAFALAAYVPMLLTAPGRVSADTKTYLTIDPGGVLAQAPSMWDPTVGAGTVPHQNIGYLFPLGPYYWLLDAISVPDWLAQRLLWGTLAFAASFGTYRLLRWLGWQVAASLVAGAAYGFSPYLLSYLARLSVILAPWAAMPWLILWAARAVRTRSWRPAAWFACIVAAVGSVNATSLVLVGLAPLCWLGVDALTRRTTIRDTIAGAARIGVLCLGVSAWWIAGLRVQGTYGLPILRYTETYQAVASASTPPEILRGLGYWFFYGGDRLDTWVGPSGPYIDHPALMLLGFAVAGISLLGLLTVFPGRGRAAVLLLVGLVVSVGAAPLDNPSLYGRAFRWFATETTVGAALRSTPRAAPLVLLALAMGLGAAVEAVGRMRAARTAPRAPLWLAPAAAVGLVALQLFPWFTARAHTPSLERAETLPSHVTELADWLDGTGEGRVYAIPGADFAHYRWGGTVDPVLPGLVERDVLYRELVPQGGAGTADLLNAFERRLADGWFEPESLEPLARLLDVDTVVVRNDLEHERYRLARPAPLWRDVTAVLGQPDHAGPLVADDTVIPLVDASTLAATAPEAFPVNAAFDLGGAAPVSLSTAPPIVVAGSGDGLVDLAAAGLLEPDRPILYAASVGDAEQPPGTWWVVTDSDRAQGRHWSTLGSNLGAVEAATPLVIDDDPGDQRLDLFESEPGTIAVHRGDVTAVRASYYGNRIAYTPEDAPFFAIDGDPTTAWRAGVFDEAIGLVWEVDLATPAPTDTISLLQPTTGVIDRFITEVRITIDDDRSVDVTLDDMSRTAAGQSIQLPAAGYTRLRIEVLRDNVGPLSSYAGRPGVGLAEVSIPGIVDDRVVRVARLDAPATDRLTHVFTRERIDPATSNRTAPEPALRREFALTHERTLVVTAEARLAADAPAEVVSALVDDSRSVVADRVLHGDVGSRGAAAADGDPGTAWQTPFDDSVGATLRLDAVPDTTEVTVTWLDDHLHSTPTTIEVLSEDGRQVVALDSPSIVDGRATAVASIEPVSGAVALTITDVDARTSPEYFSGVQQQLPIAIVEVALGATPPVVVGEFDATCRTDLLEIAGQPIPVRLSGDARAALEGDEITITACAPVTLPAGEHRLDVVRGTVTGVDVDRVVLDAAGSAVDAVSVAVATPPRVVAHDATTLDVVIGPIASAGWLSLNQSWNAGWTASVDGVDLGTPILIDGYANGWRVEAGTDERVVEFRWTPQRSVDVARWISICFGIALLGILVATRRTPAIPHGPHATDRRVRPHRWSMAVLPVAAGVLFVLVAGPPAALAAVGVAAAGRRVRWLPAAVIVIVGAVVATGIVGLELWRDYPPGPDWPARFGWASALTWIVVAAAVVPAAYTAVVPTGCPASVDPSRVARPAPPDQ